MDPKLNLAAYHTLLMFHPNIGYRTILMINFLFEKYDTYYLIVSSVKPRKCISFIQMWWSVVVSFVIKKEPIRSGDRNRNPFCFDITFVIIPLRYDNLESVEWNIQKPNWNLQRTLFSDKKFVVWSWIIRSVIVETSRSSEIGMKFGTLEDLENWVLVSKRGKNC